MRNNYASDQFRKFNDFLRRIKVPHKIIFFAMGTVSTIWFLVRVIPKPSRAAYPCMKAAAPLASSFITYLIGITSFTFLFRKARKRMMQSRYLVASVFIVLGLAAGAVAMVNNENSIWAMTLAEPQVGNDPVGEAKGTIPGRVVWMYDKDATDENCANVSGDYWFMDSNTDQTVVSNMLSEGIHSLTGTSDDAAAWDSIFVYRNRTNGDGNVGYTAGEKIVIKTNNNAAAVSSANINTSSQVCYAILDQLINIVGVAQSDISIGDPNCMMTDATYNKLHDAFPNVTYYGHDPTPTATSENVIFGSDGSFSNKLPQDYIDAKYMINIPVFKKHHRAGISLTSKNHFGSIAPYTDGAWHLHPSLPLPEANGDDPNVDDLATLDYGVYRCLVDIMGHKDLGGKTILYLVDGLWSSTNWGHPPIKWRMYPFNDDWPNSLFLSQDPVAIQSVCYDFLFEEFDENHPTEGSDVLNGDTGPYSRFPAADDFLHQAASPANWPAGIEYDPENDGTVLGSLGVHEHWNNAIEKQYTRNLGTGNGIELVLINSQTTFDPDNSGLLSDNVTSIYVDSFNVKWFGTDMGISRYDGTNWTDFTADTDVPSGNGLLSNNVREIKYERTAYGHEIWIATDGGLGVAGFDVDGVTSATTYTTDNSDILSNDILSIGVDIRHNRWAATPIGISVYKGSDWADTNQYMGEDSHTSWLDWDQVGANAMAPYDNDSLILVGTDSSGVLRYIHDEIDGITGASPYSETWAQLSKTVNSITVIDTTQWYGTLEGGAFKHEGNQTKSYWTQYTLDSGLISLNVRAIEIDSAGNVWFGTDMGLSIKTSEGWYQYPSGKQASDLDVEPDSIEALVSWTNGTGYGDGTGLISPVVNDIKVDFDGTIWVATTGGIQTFDEVPTEFGIGPIVAQRIVFIKETHSGTVTPEDGTTYTADAEFGSGDEIDGWYCVYNGTGTSVEITGLDAATIYRVMVLEYTGEAGSEVYVTESSNGNPMNFETLEGPVFSPDFEITENFQVYPIPFNDHLIIQFNNENLISGSASIYSVDGKLQKQVELKSSMNRINTSDLESGIYILHLRTGSHDYSYRIVK
jgi:hypothetical protein